MVDRNGGIDPANADYLIECAIWRDDHRQAVLESSGSVYRIPSAEVVRVGDEVERSLQNDAVKVMQNTKPSNISRLTNSRPAVASPDAMKDEFLDHFDAGVQFEPAASRRGDDTSAVGSHRVIPTYRVEENCGVDQAGGRCHGILPMSSCSRAALVTTQSSSGEATESADSSSRSAAADRLDRRPAR